MSNPFLNHLHKTKKLDVVLGNSNAGITLIEMLVVSVIIAILSAIAVPNVLGMFNFGRVKEGIAQVEGGFKEAQRQAIRLGKQCRVTINAANNTITAQTVEATPRNCLLSERKLNDNLEISTNDAIITFGSKGNPDNDPASVYIVYMTGGTLEQRCLVIAPGLGIMRTGDYDGDPTDIPNLDANNCS